MIYMDIYIYKYNGYIYMDMISPNMGKDMFPCAGMSRPAALAALAVLPVSQRPPGVHRRRASGGFGGVST